MGVSFEPLGDWGWLARIGTRHFRYGDPYEAVAFVRADGFIKGFTYRETESPFRLMQELRRAVRNQLNLRPTWERIRNMADKARYLVRFKGIEIIRIGDGVLEEFFEAGELQWSGVDDAGAVKIEREAERFLDAMVKHGEARLKKG